MSNAAKAMLQRLRVQGLRDLLPAVLLGLSVATALYQGRNWLTPPELEGRPILGFLFVAMVVLPPLALLTMRPTRHRDLTALLGSFFVLWIAAWQPDTRALGAMACGPLLWAAVRRHWIWRVFALGSAALLIACAIYERTYGLLDTAGVRAILQTHAAEATSFVLQEINRSLLALWALLAVALLSLGHQADRHRYTRRTVSVLAIGLSAVLLPFGGKEFIAKAKIVRTAQRQMGEEQQSLVPRDQIVAHRDESPNIDVVLVLGESTSRRLWQLNGGPLPSTPRMYARGDAVINFTDVVAAHSHTVPALSAMFYRRLTKGADGALSTGRVSLVDVLARVGIETNWFSAQPAFGKWSGPISNLAFTAKHTQIATLSGGAAGAESQTTKATLEALASNVRPSRLLVHHLNAAHWPYCSHELPNDRFEVATAGAAWFGEAKDRSDSLSCYIRALRRVDYELDRLDQAVQSRSKPTILLFVPDHGEDVEGGHGHISSSHTPAHVEIPMLISFNPAAREVLAAKEIALRNHRHEAFVNAWVFELVLDVFGVRTNNIKLQSTSLASTAYRPGERVLYHPSDGQVHYDKRGVTDKKAPLDLARLNLRERKATDSTGVTLFAHRVNTIGKALDAKHLFDGIEMDIVYDAARDELFVYHPPAPNVGLSLEHQLEITADEPNLQVWLDMKNVSKENFPSIMRKLQTLDRRFSLRSRAIVEIPAVDAGGGIASLSKAGWKVSLYTPYELGECNNIKLSDPAAPTCVTKAQEVLLDAQRLQATYLSFDYILMPAVRRYIATQPGAPRLLSWRIDLDATRPDLRDELDNMPGFAGIIISMPSAYQR
jgi:glucan phosphoethanolaminetransferase (alkaline phosphatase superfamily)